MDDCNTKYPILLVHGTGFRDRKRLGYWGRIPKALEARGTRIFYGEQDSWGSIEENAHMLRSRLSALLAETGCEKVNIIAHSKGGLEARYLASTLGCGGQIASISTISAPHHGSKVMDILWRLPRPLLRLAAVLTNFWFRLLGDEKPDFYHACEQFTTWYMDGFNRRNPDAPGVYYQSFATVMRRPWSDVFLLFPNLCTGLLEGESDGLVTPESAAWTNFGGVWRGATGRGISHADSVDLRRRNFSRKTGGDGVTDIRQCYVDLVAGLREKGF